MSRRQHFALILLTGVLALAAAHAATAQIYVYDTKRNLTQPINNQFDPIQQNGIIGNTNLHTFNIYNAFPGEVFLSNCTATNGFGIPGLPVEGDAPLELLSGQSASFNLSLDVNTPGMYDTTVACPGAANFSFSAGWLILSQSPTLGVSVGNTSLGSGGTFTYPNTTAGSSSPQTFTATNLSTVAVNVSNIAVTGTGFSTSTTSLNLGTSGQASGFNVNFAPPASSNGPLTGQLILTSNDPHSPFVVNLRGTAVAAPTSQIQVTDKTTGQSVTAGGSVSMGSTTAGSTLSNVFSIKNTGTASLTISSATVSGTGYTIAGPTSPVNAGGTANFTVTYTATSTGQFAGSVNLYTNAPGASPFSFGVTTTVGSPPTASYKVFSSLSTAAITSGGTINLGSVPGDPTFTFYIYVQNTGTIPLTLSGESLSSTTGFFIAGDFPPAPLTEPGSAGSLLYLDTSTAGLASGTVTFDINGSPFTVNLLDNVPAPEPSLSVTWNSTGQVITNGASYTFTSTPAGTPTSEAFNVNDVGGAPLTFTPSVSSPQGCFVLLTPGAATATPGTPVLERVRLISSTPLTCTGSVTLTTNDPANPTFTFDLIGTVTGGSTPEPAMQVTWNATGATIINGGSYTFNGTTVGTATSEVFNVANSGAAALTITSATISSPQGCFALIAPILPPSVPAPTTSDPDPLAQARIRLDSTTAETCTGTVTLVTNDPTNPTFTFNLTGTVSN